MKHISLFLLFFMTFQLVQKGFSTTFDCEVIKYSTYCKVTANKLIHTDTVVLQINNQFGDEYANIQIHYSGNSKVNHLNAWIEDMTGKQIRSLKNSEIADISDWDVSTLYQDYFIKTFQLKYNRYPYRICYTYSTTRTQFSTIVDWTPVVFQKIPTHEGKLIVTIPRNYPVRKYIRDAFCFYSDSTLNEITYKFSSKYNGSHSEEIFAVPYLNTLPIITFVPEHFVYGVEGSSANWTTFGNWVLKLNYGLLDLPESEKKTAEELIKGIKDKKEIIKILYYYLQDHTRYINISIGIGGQKSYPASYVSKNKYGDCKALSTYMKALLSIAGINSYYVLVNSGDIPVKLKEEIPCSQFNHIFLCVPLGQDTIWLENTAKSEPFGYLSIFIQNRRALLLEENNSRLINIPGLKKEDVLLQEKIKVNVNSTEETKVDAEYLFKGYSFEYVNGINSYLGRADQEKRITKYLTFPNYELLSWKLTKSSRDSSVINLTASLQLTKFLKATNQEYYFSLLPITPGSFSPPADRKSAVQIPYPFYHLDTLTFQIPTGFEVKSLPDSVNKDSPYGKYHVAFHVNGSTIQLFKMYEVYSGFYPLGEYKSFYDFIKSVDELENRIIVLNKKSQ